MFSETSALSRSEFITLYAIKIKSGEKGMKIGELAKYLGQAAPSVTQRVDSLCEAGFVRRIRDINDKRVCFVQITDEGEKTIAASGSMVVENVSEIVNGIGTEKAEETIKNLDKISKILCANNEKNKSGRLPQVFSENIFEEGINGLC